MHQCAIPRPKRSGDSHVFFGNVGGGGGPRRHAGRSVLVTSCAAGYRPCWRLVAPPGRDREEHVSVVTPRAGPGTRQGSAGRRPGAEVPRPCARRRRDGRRHPLRGAEPRRSSVGRRGAGSALASIAGPPGARDHEPRGHYSPGPASDFDSDSAFRGPGLRRRSAPLHGGRQARVGGLRTSRPQPAAHGEAPGHLSRQARPSPPGLGHADGHTTWGAVGSIGQACSMPGEQVSRRRSIPRHETITPPARRSFMQACGLDSRPVARIETGVMALNRIPIDSRVTPRVARSADQRSTMHPMLAHSHAPQGPQQGPPTTLPDGRGLFKRKMGNG